MELTESELCLSPAPVELGQLETVLPREGGVEGGRDGVAAACIMEMAQREQSTFCNLTKKKEIERERVRGEREGGVYLISTDILSLLCQCKKSITESHKEMLSPSFSTSSSSFGLEHEMEQRKTDKTADITNQLSLRH